MRETLRCGAGARATPGMRSREPHRAVKTLRVCPKAHRPVLGPAPSRPWPQRQWSSKHHRSWVDLGAFLYQLQQVSPLEPQRGSQHLEAPHPALACQAVEGGLVQRPVNRAASVTSISSWSCIACSWYVAGLFQRPSSNRSTATLQRTAGDREQMDGETGECDARCSSTCGSGGATAVWRDSLWPCPGCNVP